MNREMQLRSAMEALITDGEVSANAFTDIVFSDLNEMKKYHQSIIDKIDKIIGNLESNSGTKQVIKSNEWGYSIEYDPLDFTSSLSEDILSLEKGQ